jgi:hypothetical protein
MEALESKALLSSGMGSVLHHRAARVHVAPFEPTASSALKVSLTTDRSVYQPGQVVKITLTETNTSNHPINVAVGPGVDLFTITHNGKVVWRSRSGAPQFIVREVLQPGQSATFTAHWTVKPGMSGQFAVHVVGFPQLKATFSVVKSAPGVPSSPLPLPVGGGTLTPSKGPGGDGSGQSGGSNGGSGGTSTGAPVPIVINPPGPTGPGSGPVSGTGSGGAPVGPGGVITGTPEQPISSTPLA